MKEESNFERQAKILKRALQYPTFDLEESKLGQAVNSVFSTKPKTRRHVRGRISGNRARAFMEHLWRQKFNSCNYKALAIKFVQYFETNDLRVIEKYIGCPKQTLRSSGSSVTRQNQTSGEVAHFLYQNTRTKNAKAGLMETLGYLTLNKETGWAILHHEFMSYFTKQKVLPPFNPPSGAKSECSIEEVSKDNLCVCPIEAKDERKEKSACMEIGEEQGSGERIDRTHKSSIPTI